MPIRHWLAASLVLLGVSATADAQGMPTPDEIKEKIRDGLERVREATPDTTIEIEGIVKITYKQIPTEPKRVAEVLQEQGQLGQLPPGTDIDQYVGMYRAQISEILNENLREMGTIEALVPIKVKSKRIPVGEWTFGMEFDGERPIALVIRGEDLPSEGKPIPLRLKTKQIDPQDALIIEFKEPKTQKEGKEKFEIQFAFMRYLAKTKTKLERAEADE